MASTRHRSPIAARMPLRTPTLLPVLLLLLTLRCAEAQGSPGPANDSSKPYGYGKLNRFTPSSAILIVVLVCAFFFLAFFSVYIRQCTAGGGGAARSAPSPAALSRRQRGLDPEVLATFPTLSYAEAKKLKIGKGTLECAVCLSEFDDDETLRLLPLCSHVFHPDCISAWLDAHVTCPVCRADLARTASPDPEATAEPQENESVDAAARQTDSFVIEVNEGSGVGGELSELARIRSERRAARFPRSRSTGDAVAQPATGVERYTLRLPEDIRREIVSAGRLQRAKSCAVAGEGSSRPWWKWGGGGGGGGGRRSVRLGRSDRWPSFLVRTISARVPAWASGRRGDG